MYNLICYLKMWVADKTKWHRSHTDLSKYFLEKLKQKVDYNEIISNQHRTSNGYTLIFEIIEVATLAQKRVKSINRLVSLIEEAKSPNISSSIASDYILNLFHQDIVNYYSNINLSRLKEGGKELNELIIKSKINGIRLKENYYHNIFSEFSRIDFSSAEFLRNSIKIDNLVECLVPYLLHEGYSTTSISDISAKLVKKANGVQVALNFLKMFDGKSKSYFFLIKTQSVKEEFDEIIGYLDQREVIHEEVGFPQISKYVYDDFESIDGESLFLIKHSTLDPHNYLRNLYEMSLKNFVSSKDRLNLSFFTNFCDSVYWRFNNVHHKFQKSNMIIDPINVPKRKSTLRLTLSTLKNNHNYTFNENDSLPHIKELRDSIYYYNLAIGSKSIENSLSLLWTSLETLLPYRLKDNDIQNIQYFVSKSLSIGAIGREIVSFALRFVDVNKVNQHALAEYSDFITFNYKSDTVVHWIKWLATNFEEDAIEDPFDLLKENSNLLCKQFCHLNNILSFKNGDLKPVEHWLNKLQSSKESISYQLDRIYLHRNQIVHSGKFINEYSNLWSNLEWYVGKLLSYCIISFLEKGPNKEFDKEMLFMELESDYDMLISLLERSKEMKVQELNSALNIISKNTWQFF